MDKRRVKLDLPDLIGERDHGKSLNAGSIAQVSELSDFLAYVRKNEIFDELRTPLPASAPAPTIAPESSLSSKPMVCDWELHDPNGKTYTFRGTRVQLGREVERIRRYQDLSDPNQAVLRTPGKPVSNVTPPRKALSAESGILVPSPRAELKAGK